MKKLRLGLALAIAFASFLGSTPLSASPEEEGTKCNCWYSLSGTYGVITKSVGQQDECIVQDCWVPIVD
jgi:hypothetical protein